ncbi:GldG family protein [candidate division KSB1 bacterium]
MKKVSVFSGILGAVFITFGLVNFLSSSFWDAPTIILVSLGSAMALFYIVLHAGNIKKSILKRKTKHLTNAVTATIMVLGIMVMLNYILNKGKIRVDLTANKHYSLSEQTVSLLENLERDVRITSFQQNAEMFYFNHIFDEMSDYTDKLIYESIDPDRNPRVAKNYGFKQYGEVYFESEDRTDKILGNGEQQIINALIRVSRGEQKTIYFTSGHGEHNIDDFQNSGYSKVRDEIIAKNYIVKKLDLARMGQIPEDCSVLVIAGPETPLFSEELQLVNDYINRGGRVFFLVDPEPRPGMTEFFDSWGIEIGENVVIEASGGGRMASMAPEIPLVLDYSNHIIVNTMNRQYTYFPLVRSVAPKSEGIPVGVDGIWLLRTSSMSWAEYDEPEVNPDNPNAPLSSKYDEGRDRRGPIPIAAVVEKRLFSGATQTNEQIAKGALVVFGDSDFASNSLFVHSPNITLFLNALYWLAEEEDLVTIPPKDPQDRRVTMTDQQANFIFYLTVIIIPGLILISGMSVFIRRKSM